MRKTKNDICNNIKDPTLEKMSFSELREKIDYPLLKDQLKYVFTKSTFYQRKYKDIVENSGELFNNFHRLPFTSKKEIVNDQLNNPPFGSGLCVSLDDIVRVHKTSGTTNRPVIIGMTRSDIEATITSGSRGFFSSGLRPENKVVHCLNYCLWMGGYTDHASLEATGATVIPYGVGNSRGLIDTILDLSVDAIHCTPSYLSILENLLIKEIKISPEELGLKLGLFGAEPGLHDPLFRKHIEDKWGFKAMNANYGMAEVLSMFGSECGEQNGLHFMGQGNIFVEIIDPITTKVLQLEEGVVGELVITNINKQAQPVVRFRTGDIVEIFGEQCDCGRKGFRFNVVGRSDDMIVVKGVNLFASLIRGRLSNFLEIINGHFQIVLDTPPPHSTLKLKVECRDALDREAIKKLQEDIIKDFDATINIKPEIELIPEGTLERTSGKTRVILKNF